MLCSPALLISLTCLSRHSSRAANFFACNFEPARERPQNNNPRNGVFRRQKAQKETDNQSLPRPRVATGLVDSDGRRPEHGHAVEAFLLRAANRRG